MSKKSDGKGKYMLPNEATVAEDDEGHSWFYTVKSDE